MSWTVTDACGRTVGRAPQHSPGCHCPGAPALTLGLQWLLTPSDKGCDGHRGAASCPGPGACRSDLTPPPVAQHPHSRASGRLHPGPALLSPGVLGWATVSDPSPHLPCPLPAGAAAAGGSVLGFRLWSSSKTCHPGGWAWCCPGARGAGDAPTGPFRPRHPGARLRLLGHTVVARADRDGVWSPPALLRRRRQVPWVLGPLPISACLLSAPALRVPYCSVLLKDTQRWHDLPSPG